MEPSTDPPDAESETQAPADRIRLVVLFGGESAEHDVSCVTARHVLAAADSDRYDVVPVAITRQGGWVTADAAARALAEGPAALPDALGAEGRAVEPTSVVADDSAVTVVLPLLHGPRGEDGTIQGLLELADVAYVGSGVLGSAVAMDKGAARVMAAAQDIPMAHGELLDLRATALDAGPSAHDLEALARSLGGYPLFVKPANMGSSIGVSRAMSADEMAAAVTLAARYDEWVLVEEGVDGREIEVAVLGDLHPQVSVPGEVRSASTFYDYEDKYLDGRAELLIPAPLDEAATAEVQALALRAYNALRCEGMARVDFFYEEAGRGFLLNEVNTIPGFTPISMYPKLWEASGLAYSALIDRLVDLALERHRRRADRRAAGRAPSLHRAGP
jgi:D-alanine-D-alanine ligase